MSPHSELVRFASIGVGDWGVMLADGVRASGLGEIVTCYAPTHAHCEKFAARYGCQIAPSFEAILADPSIEAVILATPNDKHRRQIEAAAQHGKHVMVEKPIALTVADGIAATRACAQAGVLLAVGHQSRREAGARKLKSLVTSGELGEIIGVEANISTASGMTVKPGEWRWSREQCPGGPLIQIGIHHIDTLNYLFGTITRVYGMQKHRVIPSIIDDASVTLLEFENGILGHLTSHYATARAIDIRILGTKANAIFDKVMGVTVRHDTRERVVRETIPVDTVDPICEEMAEFARCIRSGGRPEVGGEEATFALAVVVAAIESNQRGCAVNPRDLYPS
jgi:predicted dehydrogenase